MKKIVKEILATLGFTSLPYIYLYLYMQSFKNYIYSLFKEDVVYTNANFSDQPILLLALFEKSYLRKDIIRLLEISKKVGLYVVAVNTKKLTDNNKAIYSTLIDTYIEKYNYGRDFGSYKTGFTYIFNQGWNEKTKRILMLNDSVYYDSDRVEKFLLEMIETNVEVLGATENVEINYHLGSFAISFASNIINNKYFKKYWKEYSPSDVRPYVIKYGEMGLSKVLQKIVSNDSEIRSLYDAKKVRQFLMESQENTNKYVSFYRTSSLVDWPTLSISDLIESYMDYTRVNHNLSKASSRENNSNIIKFQKTNESSKYTYLTNLNDISLVINKLDNKSPDFVEKFYEYVVNNSVENARFGSQIHQNNACFVFMGLPIVKLDGIYRGMFSEQDVTNFSSLMSNENYIELVELLYKKTFGGKTYTGWKNIAFFRGLI